MELIVSPHCQVLGRGSRHEGRDNYLRQLRRGQIRPGNQVGLNLRPSELQEKNGIHSGPMFEGRSGLLSVPPLEPLVPSLVSNELATNREAGG